MVGVLYHSPRCWVRRNSLPRIACAAGAPRQTTMGGWISASSASSQGRQALISLALGARFFRRAPCCTQGRCLTTLVTYSAARSSPTVASARSSSRPAGPTNGMPSRSSYSPGASPIITIRAVAGPAPNTVWVPISHSGQAWQPRASAATSASVSPGRRPGLVSSTCCTIWPLPRLPGSRHRAYCQARCKAYAASAPLPARGGVSPAPPSLWSRSAPTLQSRANAPRDRSGRPMFQNVLRPRSLAFVCVTLLAACAAPAAAPGGSTAGARSATPTSAPPSPAASAPTAAPAVDAPLSPPVTVTVGTLGLASDAAIYIALDRGYFTAQGLDVQDTRFDAGARLIPALAASQIDAGAGSPSAGLFNALQRNIPIEIVGDKGRAGTDSSYMALLVRKDLLDSGAIKDYADFRGRKIASIANDNVDAAMVAEPIPTRAVAAGAAVRWKGSNEFYPDQQAAVLMYSPTFGKDKPEAARRFMVGYVQGLRAYYDAFFKNRDRADVVQILTRYTSLTDPRLFDEMVPFAVDPRS